MSERQRTLCDYVCIFVLLESIHFLVVKDHTVSLPQGPEQVSHVTFRCKGNASNKKSRRTTWVCRYAVSPKPEATKCHGFPSKMSAYLWRQTNEAKVALLKKIETYWNIYWNLDIKNCDVPRLSSPRSPCSNPLRSPQSPGRFTLSALDGEEHRHPPESWTPATPCHDFPSQQCKMQKSSAIFCPFQIVNQCT